jgi:hypothetical protein
LHLGVTQTSSLHHHQPHFPHNDHTTQGVRYCYQCLHDDANNEYFMKTLYLDLGDKSYPIYIGQDLLTQTDLLTQHIKGKQVMVCC